MNYFFKNLKNFTNEVFQDIQNIKLATTREVKNKIKLNIKLKKSPSYDLITGEVLHNLPKKAIIKIMLINAPFKLQYAPRL